LAKQTWQYKLCKTKISQQKSANKNQPREILVKPGKTNLAKQTSQDITQPTKIRQQKSAKPRISRDVLVKPDKTNLETNLQTNFPRQNSANYKNQPTTKISQAKNLKRRSDNTWQNKLGKTNPAIHKSAKYKTPPREVLVKLGNKLGVE